jgi:hypothetical protein
MNQVQRAATIAFVFALVSSPSFAQERISRDSRIELIRGLAHEIAVVKVVLPRGKNGIFLNAQGEVDQGKATSELRQHGPAVRPGMPILITKVKIDSDRIVFEINGGGKKGKKWYQRIQIGVGTATAPIVPDSPTAAYGSSVTLTFPGKVPELTVAQVKSMLGPVLDFDRHSPTVLYEPSVPPEIKEAIKNHQVIEGMDRDAVLSSKGPPDRKVREVRDGVEIEDWIYGLPPHVLFVTFEGDVVVSVRQH